MALVQIDLQRGPARKHTHGSDVAEGDHAAAHQAAVSAAEVGEPRAVRGDCLAPATAGLVLAGGLVLLAPLAAAAAGSLPTRILLLAGLAALGLFTALLRPASTGADP